MGNYIDTLIAYGNAWIFKFVNEESTANDTNQRAKIASKMLEELFLSDFSRMISLVVIGLRLLFLALAPYQVILMGILLVLGILFDNYILEKTTQGQLDLTKIITHLPSIQDLQGFYPDPESQQDEQGNEIAMFILYLITFSLGTLFMLGSLSKKVDRICFFGFLSLVYLYLG